nr:uncharacterized protein LOC110380565 [Helicoverpa armigera]
MEESDTTSVNNPTIDIRASAQDANNLEIDIRSALDSNSPTVDIITSVNSPGRNVSPPSQSAPIPTPPPSPKHPTLSDALSLSQHKSSKEQSVKSGQHGSVKSGQIGSIKSGQVGSIKSGQHGNKMLNAIKENLLPQDKSTSERVDELKDTVKNLASDIVGSNSNHLTTNIDKIATMSKALTNEANALRKSIKYLSEDIARTKQQLCACNNNEDVNFPYHLFLIEIVINKIHMKCECFDFNVNNLVISALFLGKSPIILYDSSFGEIDNYCKLNVGKSTLFAMTYDKICSIKEFEIVLLLTKQPPCSTCVTKIAETHMDFTSEFMQLREELCKKWAQEQPTDNILCTTSTPLTKNMYYLSCCDGENRDSIGVIEVSVRMSFLGKEINTAFRATPKVQGCSQLIKDDHGMTMYSSHKVEMDDQGKILLDEGVMAKSRSLCPSDYYRRSISPQSQASSTLSRRSYEPYPVPYRDTGRGPKYDEIYTKMNVNELRIKVPKSSKVERMGRYDKIQELCSCESTPNNSGEQIQFELPKDATYPEKTYTSNLKYTLKSLERPCERKDKKIINVTPTSCPAPVNMEKVLHPLKDVFILKIGKKLETQDKKTDLEIELVTPKAPCDKLVDISNTSQQCGGDDTKLESMKQKGKSKKGKGGKGKGKGKAGKKGKKGKKK